MAVNRKRRSGKRCGPQRALIHPVPGIAKARGIAGKHFDIGHQVVAKCGRLGWLQMRKAGHQGLGVRLGLGDQGLLQVLDLASRAFASLADPEPKIQRYLVIARPCRMQPPSRRADQLAQTRLDIHVNVFVFVTEREGARGHFRLDLRQTALDRRLVRP